MMIWKKTAFLLAIVVAADIRPRPFRGRCRDLGRCESFMVASRYHGRAPRSRVSAGVARRGRTRQRRRYDVAVCIWDCQSKVQYERVVMAKRDVCRMPSRTDWCPNDQCSKGEMGYIHAAKPQRAGAVPEATFGTKFQCEGRRRAMLRPLWKVDKRRSRWGPCGVGRVGRMKEGPKCSEPKPQQMKSKGVEERPKLVTWVQRVWVES